MQLPNLIDYIIEIPNFMSVDHCNAIVNWAKNKRWNLAGVGDGSPNTDIRNCYRIHLENSPYDGLIFDYASNAIRKYHSIFDNVPIAKDTGYTLLKYEKGGHHVQHVDSYALIPRIVTLSITMNDEYERGAWSFFDGGYKLHPKIGSAVMFPSNFMYPHAIQKVT